MPAGQRDWLAYGALPLEDSEQNAVDQLGRDGITGVALVRVLDGGR